MKHIEIDKNVKDLEYHWILNLFTTSMIIYATFVIAFVFNIFVPLAWKIVGLYIASIIISFVGAGLYEKLKIKKNQIMALEKYSTIKKGQKSSES